MREKLYYPYLEPKNTNWIRFALLYMESISPIIPLPRRDQLSDGFKKIMNETDLITPYNPRFDDGYNATLDSIKEIETYLQDNNYYNHLFNNGSNLNWNNQDTWQQLLFREKYGFLFERFCREKSIGIPTEGGIKVPKDIAFIYMTNLAKRIGQRNEMDIISDNDEYYTYQNYKEINDTSTNAKLISLENIIKLSVPSNFKSLTYDEIINFRNKNRELIKVLNKEFEKLSNGNVKIDKYDFYNEFDKINNEIIKEIIPLGIGVSSIPLSVYVLLNDNGVITSDIKELLGLVGLCFGSYVTISKIVKQRSDIKNCMKYFVRLTKMNT